MQGVFMGHLSFYNKNQIRDKLLLVLIFLKVKSAKKIVDRKEPVIWDILEHVMKVNEKADFVKPPGYKPATLSEKEGRTDVRQDNEHAG